MINPQKENGFMPIAIELVEILSQIHLTGKEHQLIYAVWRKTWGWKKKEDWISLSQLEEMTGLSNRDVCRSQKSLLEKNILKKEDNKLSFNKYYHKWVLTKMPVAKTSVTKMVSGTDKNVSQLLTKMSDTIDTNTIDNIQKDFLKKRNIELDKLKEKLTIKGIKI